MKTRQQARADQIANAKLWLAFHEKMIPPSPVNEFEYHTAQASYWRDLLEKLRR